MQSQLARRRDLAAEALAFERAAQVQAAMTAIEWVVAEQKAALLEPENMDIHGWADGILVSFRFREGRLCGWQQRQRSEEASRPHVRATPLRYANFADRNAALAARLSIP